MQVIADSLQETGNFKIYRHRRFFRAQPNFQAFAVHIRRVIPSLYAPYAWMSPSLPE